MILSFKVNLNLVNQYIGNIKLIGARDNKYSTALGNIIYFIGTLKLKGEDYTMMSKRDMEILSSPGRIVNNENTMPGKNQFEFKGNKQTRRRIS